MSNPVAVTPPPYDSSDKMAVVSTPNSLSSDQETFVKENDDEDDTFDKFFESIKDGVEDLHKVSGGNSEVIPTPNLGGLFEQSDEVVSRMLVGAAILAALRRNTLFSVSGPAAIAAAVFYPIIYLAMVFTDMFLFGNVKFEGE